MRGTCCTAFPARLPRTTRRRSPCFPPCGSSTRRNPAGRSSWSVSARTSSVPPSMACTTCDRIAAMATCTPSRTRRCATSPTSSTTTIRPSQTGPATYSGSRMGSEPGRKDPKVSFAAATTARAGSSFRTRDRRPPIARSPSRVSIAGSMRPVTRSPARPSSSRSPVWNLWPVGVSRRRWVGGWRGLWSAA